MPLPEILNPLELNDSLSKAVLHREGVLGSLLKAVEYAEQANDEGLTEQLAALPFQAQSSTRSTPKPTAGCWTSSTLNGTQSMPESSIKDCLDLCALSTQAE